MTAFKVIEGAFNSLSLDSSHLSLRRIQQSLTSYPNKKFCLAKLLLEEGGILSDVLIEMCRVADDRGKLPGDLVQINRQLDRKRHIRSKENVDDLSIALPFRYLGVWI